MEPREDAVRHAVDCTTPIYSREYEYRPKHIGSGVVIRLSDRTFVATAAHVIDALDSAERPYVGLGSDLVPFEGTVTRTKRTSLGRPADPYDVAVAEVDAASKGLTDFPALSPAWIDTSETDYDDEIFRLIGFPNVLQDTRVRENDIEASLLHLNAVSRPGERDARSGRLTRLVLGYDPAEIIIDGKPAKATKLRGTSGGGLWRWLPDGGLALTALMTDREMKAKRILGTRMWMVAEGIRQIAPELAYLLAPR